MTMRSSDEAISLVQKQIAETGTAFNADIEARTKALYKPLISDDPRLNPTADLDVPYGSDPRQRLDIHYPNPFSPTDLRPIFIYLPGGGFVRGDKADDPVFYRNIGRYLAANGVVCVLANYRLAPAHTWPSGIVDAAAIVSWVRENAATYGGDADRIVLSGHSSGAVHVAGYVFDERFHPAGGSGVSAGVLLSGGYSVHAAGMAQGRRSYFGDDETTYHERSPMTHVGASTIPVLIAMAEYDPPQMSEAAFELGRALTRRDGRSPKFLWLEGHNHLSYIFSLGTSQSLFGEKLLDFINEH